MSTLIRTHISLARASIRANRARSFLTCLGIAVGIASITLIFSLTGSISRLISNELSDNGSGLLVIRPSSTKDTVTSIVETLTTPNLYQTSNLSLADVASIAASGQVSAVAPVAVSTNTVMDEQNFVSSATIVGTTPDFADISDLTIRQGTFLSEDNRANSVVIGHMLSLLIFNTTNPVGRTLTFQGQRFIVVGVLAEASDAFNFNNIDYNHSLIMDISVLEQLIGTPQIQQIDLLVVDPVTIDDVVANVASILKSNHSGDTNFSILSSYDLTHPAGTLLSIISGVLAIIAGIALIIGGIGVMNIMLVSVIERTHEIGIRKSVGASSTDILLQFIFESIILSLLGGVIGIIFGYILAFFISIITPFTPFVDIYIVLVTLLVSVVVGIVFGTYPALRAASADPIESLRHYR